MLNVSVSFILMLSRVGQNRIYTPYMTVYLVISLQKMRVYTVYMYGSDQPYVLAKGKG